MARPKVLDRIEALEKSNLKLEQSSRNTGLAIWAIVAGLLVLGVSIILMQTDFIAKFV